MGEEELRRELEELPEGGVELGREETAPSTEGGEQGEGGPGGAGEAVSEEGAATGASPEEVEERRRRLRELIQTYRDVSSFIKELRELGPDERALVHSIVEKVLTPEEPKVVEKPVIVEKPRVEYVEKPVPVVPPEVSESAREATKAAYAALSKVEEAEARLSRLEEALQRIAETQAEVVTAVKAFATSVSETAKLHEELRRVREELQRIKEDKERRYMIIPKAEKLNPDGSVVREYDYHPALKAMEKRTEFAVEKLGPAIIEELRQTRADVSGSINRLVTLLEAIITPELRRRAPRIVSELEDSVRKLVGSMRPEERIEALQEIQEKVEKLEGGEGK